MREEAIAMTSMQWIGVAIIVLILAFGWFAFRQGTKVKPEDRNSRGGLPPGAAS
jgi:ammonia channel protein AmtB